MRRELWVTVPLAGILTACGVSGPGSGATSLGTLTGHVLSAPSCPVQQSASPCPPRPVVGGRVQVYQAGRLVEGLQTGSGGRFVVHLYPGNYLLVAHNAGGYASTARQRVTVTTGLTTTATLTVDSGIR